jgi:dienelactone hydrolase
MSVAVLLVRDRHLFRFFVALLLAFAGQVVSACASSRRSERATDPARPAASSTLRVASVYRGQSLALPAWLSMPASAPPFGLVILAHGCNGVDPSRARSGWKQMNDWAGFFRGEGYATMIVDSFTPRGVTHVCDDKTNPVPPSIRAVDLYSAATYAARLPQIAPRKIAVFGDSHGGGTVLAALNEQNPNVAEAKTALDDARGKLAGAIALYPNCGLGLTGRTFHAPALVVTGSADDWADPSACMTLTNFPTVSATPVTLGGYGSPVTIVVHADATHAFDVDEPQRVTPGGHRLRFDPVATARTKAEIKAFLSRHAP